MTHTEQIPQQQIKQNKKIQVSMIYISEVLLFLLIKNTTCHEFIDNKIKGRLLRNQNVGATAFTDFVYKRFPVPVRLPASAAAPESQCQPFSCQKKSVNKS